jgi:hypothetical protein
MISETKFWIGLVMIWIGVTLTIIGGMLLRAAAN